MSELDPHECRVALLKAERLLKQVRAGFESMAYEGLIERGDDFQSSVVEPTNYLFSWIKRELQKVRPH